MSICKTMINCNHKWAHHTRLHGFAYFLRTSCAWICIFSIFDYIYSIAKIFIPDRVQSNHHLFLDFAITRLAGGWLWIFYYYLDPLFGINATTLEMDFWKSFYYCTLTIKWHYVICMCGVHIVTTFRQPTLITHIATFDLVVVAFIRWIMQLINPLSFQTRFPKSGPTNRRQVINPGQKTPNATPRNPIWNMVV